MPRRTPILKLDALLDRRAAIIGRESHRLSDKGDVNVSYQRTALLATLAAFLFATHIAHAADAPPRTAYDLPETGSVKIVRDKFGTPHIIAGDDRSLFFGAGYAQAQDQLENLCKNYLRAQGRGAEQDGFAEVIFDQLVRSLELPRRAQQA